MKMKIRMSELRRLIRQVLLEGPAGPGVAADPTDVRGFYPYEVDRGVNIQSYWYKSPGRTPGSDGDPGRPADALEYLGMTPKKPEEGEEKTSD